MNLTPFILYGLLGCPHCAEAETYLRKVGVPTTLVIANEDPIADAGVKQLTGSSQYPILIYRPTKEYVVGFLPEKYERLARAFYSVSSAGVPGVFGGEQQPIAEVAQQTPVSEDTTRTA